MKSRFIYFFQKPMDQRSYINVRETLRNTFVFPFIRMDSFYGASSMLYLISEVVSDSKYKKNIVRHICGHKW